MIIKNWNTKYSRKDETVVLRNEGQYADGSTALTVYGLDGIPCCTTTVCLIEYNETPSEGNVFIKNYSENEGVLEALQAAGVVGDVTRVVPCGYVEAYEVPLLVEVD